MSKPEIPAGCVIIRLADLAALLAARPGPVPPLPVPAVPSQPGPDAWSGLASAVAMLTARIGNHDVDLGQLADPADMASVVTALVAMASAALRGCLEDGAGQFLQDMGALAVNRGQDPEGRSL